MSGPLDTQAPSFTANPPMSSTGNTSPSHESSVIGVTAQLGMRLNELKGLQARHGCWLCLHAALAVLLHAL